MAEIIGKMLELGISIEGTRGTPVATASKWVKNVSADVMARAEKVIDDNSQGVMEDSTNSRVIKKWYDGDIAGIVHADVVGYLFFNVFGQVNTTTVTGAVRNHAFSMLQNILHPTLSLIAKDGGVSQEVFDTGVVNTLEITATTDDFVRFSSNLMFAEATTNTDTSSYDTEYDFIGKDITIKTAATEAGLSSATAIKAKEVGITFETGAIADFSFGSFSPDNYNSKLSISGNITKNYVDDTFKDLFTADTAVYMEIAIVGEAVLAGANSPKIVTLLNKVQIQSWERSGGNDDLVTEEIEFKAFYNNTDAEMATVSVQNLTNAYEV